MTAAARTAEWETVPSENVALLNEHAGGSTYDSTFMFVISCADACRRGRVGSSGVSENRRRPEAWLRLHFKETWVLCEGISGSQECKIVDRQAGLDASPRDAVCCGRFPASP